MSSRPPSPAEQVCFLRQLQRLLDEGSFVATYKYALLHAIADLCVALGDDSGAELTLPTHDIAERFVELYWRQAVPFPAGPDPDLLAQNDPSNCGIQKLFFADFNDLSSRSRVTFLTIFI